MGQNIRDFKSWQRLNEDTSFLGWIGDLATSAFTGKAVDPAPSSVTSIAEPGSATATVIDKAASALGIKTDAKAGDKEKGAFWHQRQHTMKILLNSLYGATALGSFRYGSVILSESITLSGQRIIQESALCANHHMNKVIKGEIEL